MLNSSSNFFDFFDFIYSFNFFCYFCKNDTLKTIQEIEANLNVSSKAAVVRVAKAIEDNPALAEELFNLAISDRQPLAWRAAWVFSHMADYKSPIITIYLPRIINALIHIDHYGQRGCFLRVVSRSMFRLDDYSNLLDFSIDTLLKPTFRVSHKFYCLDLLEKFAIQIPDLKGELIMVVEEGLPNFETNSLKRKGHSWLKKMSK